MSTKPCSHIDNATGLISALGGPSLHPEDLQWLNDLEAGRLLLEWISNQVSDYAILTGGPSGHDLSNCKRRLHAALRDSALEVDEVSILNDERISIVVAEPRDGSRYQAEYMPPSQLKKRASFIDREITMVQDEVNFLRSRISETKEASNKLDRAIKLLQHAVFHMDTKIRSSEDRLSELSITSDTTILTTITNSEGLLDDLESLTQNSEFSDKDIKEETLKTDEYPDLAVGRNLLLESQTALATLTASLEKCMANLNLSRLPEANHIKQLQVEANRLQTAFDAQASESTVESGRSFLERIDQDAAEELSNICDALEQKATLREQGHSSKVNVLDDLLSELHEGHPADGQGPEDQSCHGIIIEDILSNAWMKDQVAILQLHEQAFDKALSGLDAVLDPLERVYTALAQVARCIEEAEATLEAFVEELGEISLDSSKGYESHSATVRVKETEMEKLIKDALIDYKGKSPHGAPIYFRPSGSSPLLLFSQEDILAELQALKARSARLEAAERAWSADVLRQYSGRPVHHALPQIYANAPINTSPPFAFPRHVSELEARARIRATELQILANTVQEEVLETFANEDNVKRMEAFVEKWC